MPIPTSYIDSLLDAAEARGEEGISTQFLIAGNLVSGALKKCEELPGVYDLMLIMPTQKGPQEVPLHVSAEAIAGIGEVITEREPKPRIYRPH